MRISTSPTVEDDVLRKMLIVQVGLVLQTPIKDSYAAAKAISSLEGVVDHGLFMDMVDVCIIAGKNGVEVKAK